jgi:hypothetical protein
MLFAARHAMDDFTNFWSKLEERPLRYTLALYHLFMKLAVLEWTHIHHSDFQLPLVRDDHLVRVQVWNCIAEIELIGRIQPPDHRGWERVFSYN